VKNFIAGGTSEAPAPTPARYIERIPIGSKRVKGEREKEKGLWESQQHGGEKSNASAPLGKRSPFGGARGSVKGSSSVERSMRNLRNEKKEDKPPPERGGEISRAKKERKIKQKGSAQEGSGG